MKYESLFYKLMREAERLNHKGSHIKVGFEVTNSFYSLKVSFDPVSEGWEVYFDEDDSGAEEVHEEGRGFDSLIDTLFDMHISDLSFLDPKDFYAPSTHWAIWCESDEDEFTGYVGSNNNYQDIEDFLHDAAVFKSEDEAADFIANDPVIQAHIEIGDAEYRPVDISEKIKNLRESTEEEKRPNENVEITGLEFWDEEDDEWNGDRREPKVSGSIDVKVSFKNKVTGTTWTTIYTIPATGYPINFYYSPARLATWPGDPEELEWDGVTWSDLDLDNIEWKKDLTPFPEDELTDEEYEELWNRVKDLISKNSENIMERKTVNLQGAILY